MDFNSVQQHKSGSLSSLRAGRVLRPSPLANDQLSVQTSQSNDPKRSTPDNIRRLRSQKVYSSPSDNIMTPITRKLSKKGSIQGSKMKMNFNDNLEPETQSPPIEEDEFDQDDDSTEPIESDY